MHCRRKWQPTPVFLPGESQGRGAWWTAISGVAQSRTRLKRLSSSSSSSRLVIIFLPRSKRLLISWLQSPSAVILEPKKIKSATVSPSIYHEVMGPDAIILVFCILSFKQVFHSPLSPPSRGSRLIRMYGHLIHRED